MAFSLLGLLGVLGVLTELSNVLSHLVNKTGIYKFFGQVITHSTNENNDYF